MKQLLIEEMKRAIEIMESKDELRKTKKVVSWTEVDRDTTELRKLLHAIRRHSIILDKSIT